MNMSLYENRSFLHTFLKQLEKSLQTSNQYIDQYLLCILLFSVRHKNHLDSENSVFLGKFLELQIFSLLLSVSDEEFTFISSMVSNDLQSEHFSSIQLPLSELQLNLSTRSCSWVGNFSLKIYFYCSIPLQKEKSFHIFHINMMCVVCKSLMYTPCEAQENCRVVKMLTIYLTLPQMTHYYRHYHLQLTKYHAKSMRDIAVVCIFSRR